MSEALAYGIDFGTSNSSLSVAYDDGSVRVLPVGKNGKEVLPSLVYLNRSGNRLAGNESVRAYLADGSARTRCNRCSLVDAGKAGIFTQCRQYFSGSGCQDSRLISQIKSDLATEGLDTTHSWAHDYAFNDLVAVVLRRLKRHGDRATGADVRRVALGHPVRFPGTEAEPERLQAAALARLRLAAERAGFQEVVFVPEPQAAVAVEQGNEGVAVCADFGGGTFDVVVMHKAERRGEVLALRGVPVGGEAFDAALFDAKLAPALGLDRTVTGADGRPIGLPSWVRSELRTLGGLKRLLTDNDVAVLVRELAGRSDGDFARSLDELLYGGQAYACHRAVEAAKVDLTSSDKTVISLHRGPHLDFDVPVTRSEFEALIEKDLRRVRYCLEDALEDADVDVDDVALVTRTGGSSRIPAFLDVLEEMFGKDRVLERDAFATVVTGLGHYAYAEWRHAHD